MGNGWHIQNDSVVVLGEVTLTHRFNDIFIILTDSAKIYKQTDFFWLLKKEKNREEIG